MTQWISIANAFPPHSGNRRATLRDSLGLGQLIPHQAMLLVLLFTLAAPVLPGKSTDAGAAPDPDLPTSSIQGELTVMGPSGESTILPGVTLKLSGGALGQKSLSTLTDAQGHYEFDHLGTGSYQLEAQGDGFQPFAKTVLLGRNEVHLENITLQIVRLVQKVEVHDQAPLVSTDSTTPAAQLTDRKLESLPLAEQKFKEALPLVPGVVRTRDGQLNMKGEVENQGMLLVDSAQTVDPVTGSFSIPVPLDAIQTMSVSKAPYDSQYGGFSGGLTTIATKAPSSQWKYGLMDFIPGVRGKSGHIVGISDETPRLFFGGPILKNKINFSEAATYDYNNRPIRGLAWPHNESRIEGFNSLSSFQVVLSPQHLLSVNVNEFSNRVRYADIDSLIPQPASSNDGQRGVSIGGTDNYQFGSGAMLSTIFRYTRFDSNAYGQGPDDMLISPEGWGGNFFNAWTRSARQFELLPLYQFPEKTWLGQHELKAGVDLTHISYQGNAYSHPIQLLAEDGSLAERIDFQGPGQLHAQDTEVAGFIQDHWRPNDHLALDLGGRFLSQSIGRRAAFAPRAGLVYSPGSDRKTIIRTGAGVFYGSVPMLAADFPDNPMRVVTLFGGNGLPMGPPTVFQNVYVGTVQGLGSLRTVPFPDTSARNFTSNIEVDRELSPSLMLRVSYLYSQTRDLYVVTPFTGTPGTPSLLGLADTGGSYYHEFETTLHYRSGERSEFNVSYVHSRARGDLNTLSDVFVPFEQPVIRPDVIGNFASDVPNRVVSWGIFSLPWKLTLSPVVDVHTGFPYSDIDTFQNYVGAPNSQRFPGFFSLDVRIYREFRLGKLPLMERFKNQKVRFGVYSINLTNHLNYLDVYNNVTSRYFGHFAGFQHRVDGLVIDLVE